MKDSIHLILKRLRDDKTVEHPDPIHFLDFDGIFRKFSLDERAKISHGRTRRERVKIFIQISSGKGDELIFILQNVFSENQWEAGGYLTEKIRLLKSSTRKTAAKAYLQDLKTNGKTIPKVPQQSLSTVEENVEEGFSVDQIFLLSGWLCHFSLINDDERDEIRKDPDNSFEGQKGKIFEVIQEKKKQCYKAVRGRLFPALILRLTTTRINGMPPSPNMIDRLNKLAAEIMMKEHGPYSFWEDNRVVAHQNLLGEGGNGIVLSAYHLGRVYAVKTVKNRYVDSIPAKLRTAFESEFGKLKMLNHHNIIQYFPEIRHEPNNTPFFAMEYVGAGTLERFWSRSTGTNFAEKIDLDTKLYIALQIWRGVAYLHSNDKPGKHIVHKDIKPGNVLVTFDYTVKLCDFGFSRYVPNISVSELCVDLGRTGTVTYNPPELLKLQTSHSWRFRDAKVDVWMAGLTILHLFCEEYPFRPEQYLFGSELEYLYQLAIGPIGILTEVEKYAMNTVYDPNSTERLRREDISVEIAKNLNISDEVLQEIEKYEEDPRRQEDLENLETVREAFGVKADDPSAYKSPLYFEHFPVIEELLNEDGWNLDKLYQIALKPLKWRYGMRPRAKEMEGIYTAMLGETTKFSQSLERTIQEMMIDDSETYTSTRSSCSTSDFQRPVEVEHQYIREIQMEEKQYVEIKHMEYESVRCAAPGRRSPELREIIFRPLVEFSECMLKLEPLQPYPAWDDLEGDGLSEDQGNLLWDWLHFFNLIDETEREAVRMRRSNNPAGLTMKILDVVQIKHGRSNRIFRGRILPALILRLATTPVNGVKPSIDYVDGLNKLASEIIKKEHGLFMDWEDESIEAHHSILGEGKLGIVCTASYCGRVIAVKTEKPGDPSTYSSGSIRETIESKYNCLRELSHPNITTFLVCNQPDQRPFFAMEFVGAGSLERFWTASNGNNFAEKIDFNTKLHVARQLWSAVAYLHNNDTPCKHIVHKDIKPSNVLVTFDYTVKLSDSSSYRFVEDISLCDEGPHGRYTGTDLYNPPELVNPEGPTRWLDVKVDVWMAGLTLLQLFCEEYPFQTIPISEFFHCFDQTENLYRLAIGPIGILTEIAKHTMGTVYDPNSTDRLRRVDISDPAAADLKIDEATLEKIESYEEDPKRQEDLRTLEEVCERLRVESSDPTEYGSPFIFENYPSVKKFMADSCCSKKMLNDIILKPLSWRYSVRPSAKQMTELMNSI